MDNPIVAAEFSNRTQAELAANQLRSYDVACFIRADDLGGVRPEQSLIQGVKLLVSEDDLETAQEILNREQKED